MTASNHPAAVPGRDHAGRLGRHLSQVHRLVETVERVVGGLLIATILGMVVLQAAQRYLPLHGWPWTGELARYGLVWLTFALVGYLAGRGEHIGLEVVDYLVRGRLVDLVRRFADAVVALIAAAFTVDAWHLLTGAGGRTTPVMGIPLTLIYLMPVAGFALTTVRAGWSAICGRPPATPDTPETPDAPDTPEGSSG